MRVRVIGTLLVFLTAAAVLQAQRVTTESAPGAPFGTYRTFAWTPGTP